MTDPHRRYRDFDNGSWWATSVVCVGKRSWWEKVLMFFFGWSKH